MASTEQPNTACLRRPSVFVALVLLAGAYRLGPAADRLAERLAELSLTTKEPAAATQNQYGIKIDYPYISSNILSHCGLEGQQQDKLQPLHKSLAYIKTHKTGSSTVANIINRVVYGRNLTKMIPGNFIHLGWPTGFPGNVQDMDLVLNQTRYDAVANHAVFHAETWRQYLKTPMVTFTILREPVGRIVSAFHYYTPYKNGNRTWRELLDHYKDKTFVDEWRDAVFLNEMAYALGWYHSHEPLPNERDFDMMKGNKWTTEHDQNVTAIQAYIDKLDQEIDLAMILENLTESIMLLQDEMPELQLAELVWSNAQVSLKSTKAGAPKIYPTESEQEELSEMLLVDRMLYNHFHDKFLQRWNAKLQSSPLETMTRKNGLNCLYDTILQQLSKEGDETRNSTDMPKMLLPNILKDSLKLGSVKFTKFLARWQKKRLQAHAVT